jgi:thiamine-phosphate pyrophosphorylase
MTDSSRLKNPLGAAVTLAPGSAVILRHYDDSDRVGLARELINLCRPRHICVLVAGDARFALAAGADGLHLPEAMLPRRNQQLRPSMLLSVAAHSPKALAKAAKAGADFALLSPVFPTKSHPEGRAIGVLRFAAWAKKASLPVYGLGGINDQNIRRLGSSGSAGWAAIEGLIKNPKAAR